MAMRKDELLRIGLLTWGVPLAIVITVRLFTPDPSRPKDDFPFEIFTPQKIEFVGKKGTRRSDHFELWLHHPDGHGYFYRDPEPEPVKDLFGKTPPNTALKVIYDPFPEGNTLMEISVASSNAPPILSFDAVMAEYATRRRLVYSIAGIWFALGSFIFLALTRVKVKEHNGIG